MSDTLHNLLNDDPLARLPDEPASAHQALIDYEAMGQGRSLDALAKHYRACTTAVPSRQVVTLKNWSSRYNWQDRLALAHDARIARERQAREAVWAARREAIREESFSLAEQLRKRALELLAQEFAEEQVIKRNGIEITVLRPKWSMKDIATFAETYDKLARLSAGMDTEQQKIVIEGIDHDDLESLPDEELEKLWGMVKKKRKA